MSENREHAGSVEDGVSAIALESWEEYAPHISKSHADSPAFLYRGQADATWKIESTLDRLEHRYPTRRNYGSRIPDRFYCPPANRDVHLEAFKEAVRGKRGANPQDLSENEWWGLAQHHGLATPLLDWTYSPFVALFFAFEEAGYVDWHNQRFVEPEQRAVYIVPFHLISKTGTTDVPAPEVFSLRREVTQRLSSQGGVFMKMPRDTDLEANVRKRFIGETSGIAPGPWPVLTKITIPNEGRIDCLKLLNKMNINRMSLFGDLDGAAKYINCLWEIDFDTALGSLPNGVTE